MVRCAAIDLGAGSGRVMAASLRNRRMDLEEVHRFATPLVSDDSGSLVWDIDAIEREVRTGIEKAGREASLDSLGIDGWGVDFVLLDDRKERVGPAVSYRDHRTDGVMQSLRAELGDDEIYRRTGIQFLPFNTIYQLAALARRQPDLIGRAHHFLMVPDYLNFRLSGTIANEYTNATTTQLYNLTSDGWDGRLLEAAGIARPMMRPVVEAGTIIGEMPHDGHHLHVIAVASHDTASAVVGAPLEGDDEAFISSGTWSLMGVESNTPFAGALARRLNFSNEGGYARRFRVLKNIAGLWLEQRIRAELAGTASGHGILAAAAGEAKPWASLIDPADGVFLNPASMIEAIRGYCRRTGQPEPDSAGALARCVYESLALSYRRVKDELEALTGRPLRAIRIVGGGSRNRLLDQLAADACGIAVHTGPVETSVLGNAAVQMIALGVLSDIDEARSIIRMSFPGETYHPRETVPDQVWQRFAALAPSSLQETIPS